MAPVLTAAYCPPGISSEEVIHYLAERHAIKITHGFGSLKERVIRIGHMGGAIEPADVDQVLAALREFVHERAPLPA